MNTRIFFYLSFALLGACVGHPPLNLVETVDVDRYTGHWHEILRLPVSATPHCHRSEVVYALRYDRQITAVHLCHTADGIKERRGRLQIDSAHSGNAKMALQWGQNNWQKYHIIAVDSNYQSAMAGSPDRQQLLILSRERNLNDATLATYLAQAKAEGFNLPSTVMP